jgi:hypothetical protein
MTPEQRIRAPPPVAAGDGAGAIPAPQDTVYRSRGSVTNILPNGEPAGTRVMFEDAGSRSERARSFHGGTVLQLLRDGGARVLARLGFSAQGARLTVPDGAAAVANLEALRADPAMRGRINTNLTLEPYNGGGSEAPIRVFLHSLAEGHVLIDQQGLMLHDLSHGLGFLAMPDAAFSRVRARASVLEGVSEAIRNSGLRDPRLQAAVDHVIGEQVAAIDSASMQLSSAVARNSMADAELAMLRLTDGTAPLYEHLRTQLEFSGADPAQLRQLNEAIHQMENSARPDRTAVASPGALELQGWATAALSTYR